MINKIIEELERIKSDINSENEVLTLVTNIRNVALNDAIDIVKKYDNDGWVSVEEKLPKYDTRILATFITDKGSIGIEDCWYSLINRCFETYKDFEKIPLGIKILAWQPLPQPYKGE